MATRTRIETTDDLLNDGTPANETLTFALEGVTYEVDLTTDNANKLREDLAPWVAVSRPVAGRKPASRRGKATRSAAAASANEVRAWARSQGMEVSERGRVRDEVRAAYEAAHN
ncbi:MAG: histone-like nucleoid-structuring protein Lsr2 [Actinomycetes bacterium]